CETCLSDKTNTNRICNLTNNPNAEGACYKKTGFGEWRCMLTDIHGEVIESNIPPPGSAKQNTDAEQKTQTKNDEQHANEKTTIADKNADSFSKPDFSEMEEWFDIVRY